MMRGPPGATTATLLLAALLLAALAVSPAEAVPRTPPRATAGVAGGAGAAELAERGAHAANGSLYAATPSTAGTIREALGGGVVEPSTSSAGAGPPYGPPPGGLRTGGTGGSRCTGPQVCLKVEHCPPAEVDLLFECGPGWVCCVPAARPAVAAASSPSPPPTSPPTSPRPRPPQSHPPGPATPPPAQQWQPQLPPPAPSQAAPQGPHHHGHDHGHGQDHGHDHGPPPQQQHPAQQRPLQMNPEEGIAVPMQPQQRPLPAVQTGQGHPSAPQPHAPASTPTTTPADDTEQSLLPGTDVCGKVSTENRITNGKIASPGQFPWMAILGYQRRGESSVSFLCGGTLINEKYVLTAAHCISSQNRPVLVRLGEFNLTEAVDCDHDNVCAPPPVDTAVEEITPHHGFNLRNIKHDIALIRLSRSVEYSEFVRPICLPESINVTDDTKFKIAGWGKTYFRDAVGSPVLQFTDVNGVGHAECNELQPPELQPLDPGQLCAGGDKGKDACKGDSGGPLMLTQVTELEASTELLTYQMGVVSYGPDSPCGTAPLPSIYTRVAAYMPWIYDTLRP